MTSLPAAAAKLRLPAGFTVSGVYRLVAAPTYHLTWLDGRLYWLVDGQHDPAQFTADQHRIENLDPTNGRVQIVWDSTGSLSGLTAVGDELAVEDDQLSPDAGCGGPKCVRPTILTISPTDSAAQLIDTYPAAPTDATFLGFGPDGTNALIIEHGAANGSGPVSLWDATTRSMHTVISDHPFSVGLTTVGRLVVGQTYGTGALWAATTTGRTVALPLSTRSGVHAVAGSSTHLAWFRRDRTGRDNVLLSTATAGSLSQPRTVLTVGQGDFFLWPTDCLLFVVAEQGMYAVHICDPNRPVERLLDSHQVAAWDTPAGMAIAPGRLAFAFAPDLMHGPETLVILHIPSR